MRVLKTSYRCPSSTQARVSTLHGCYKPALVPRDRSLHIARRAVAPGAEPPAGVLARPLRPSTTDSASIPAAHVHGRLRAPLRPATRPSAAVVNFLPFSRGRSGAAARDRRFHQRGPLRDQGPGLRERDSALGCLIRPPGGAPRRLERARTHVFAVLGA